MATVEHFANNMAHVMKKDLRLREAAMTRGIGYWLTRREVLCPDKEALVDGDRRLTYRELNRRVNRLARGLAERGLVYGDRIAILSYNRSEFVETIMAAAKLGLILVPLNWRLTVPELAFQMKDSGTADLDLRCRPGRDRLSRSEPNRQSRDRHRPGCGTDIPAGARSL